MIAACTATTMLASTNLHALGLGNFEVQSNLDQPLRGTIALRTDQGDDIKSITAVIASREDYEKFGIDYPSYLKDIKLVLDRSSGVPVLRVSSEEIIIKEPFIHFLVRVDWSGGSFLREYTALIDPPMYAAEAPESMSEPKLAGTSETIYHDEDISSSLEDSTVVEEVTTSDIETEETTVTTDETPADEEVLFEEQATELPTDAQYGPVSQGESLSVIAQELQSQFPDLSIYQIMQVMFNENQEAFINGNMNGLMKGAVLKIGDLNAVRSVDAAEAKNFFYRQVQEWNPAALASSSDSSDDALLVGQDEYTAGGEDLNNDLFTDTSTDTDTSDSFQVGSSSDVDQATSSVEGASREGEVLALQKQITELETSLSSSSRENRELTERISLLEGQLADMNRLISVKDADLAAVQSNLAEQNDAAQVDEPVADSDINDVLVDQLDEIADEVVVEDQTDLITESTDIIDETTSDETLVTDESEEIIDDGEEIIDDAIVSEESTDLSADDSVIEEVAEETMAATTSPTPAPVVEKKSFLDMAKSKLIDDGLWKIGAGILGLLAAVLGLFFVRRRRADEEFEVSMLSIETNTASMGSTVSTTKTVADSVVSTHTESEAASELEEDSKAAEGETSFLTVYSDSDAVVQADEVDPIAEADVYIAYGRDEQAEEVLIDGIANNPGRVDIHKKLLTLYHKNNNVEGFERVAEELYSQKSILNKEVWDEISLMGKDVAPENPLFDVSSSDILATSDESEQLVDSSSVTSIDESTPESVDNEDSINDISFDDGHSQRSEFTNVDVLDIENDKKPSSIEDDDEFIELSSSAEGDDIIDITSKSAEPVQSSESLDDELEFESVELNDQASESEDDEESGLTAEVSDLEIDEDYDEARTQYELAKVFVDLGDEDGARKILDELLADNSNDPEVLSDAKKLLDEMDS